MKRLLLLLTLTLIAAAPADAPVDRTPRQEIRIAEEAVTREAWADAAAALARARAGRDGASAVLAYDQAVAAYRAGDLQQAAKAFEEAMNTEDAALAAAAAYNLGNTTFQLGSAPDQQATGDHLKNAASMLTKAMEHYRAALSHNPNDQDARANGELTWRRLQEVLEQQQQQQSQEQDQKEQQQQPDEQQADGEQQQQDQQQSGEQDQQESGEQQQDQQQSGEQDQQQPSEQQPQDQQQSGEQDQQEPGEQQPQEQQQPGEQDQQPPEAQQQQPDGPQQQAEQQQASPSGTPRKPGEMTKQEAQRMLQAIRDRERQRRLDLQKQAETGIAVTGRDW